MYLYNVYIWPPCIFIPTILKCLKIKNKDTEHIPKLLFGYIDVVTRMPIEP